MHLSPLTPRLLLAVDLVKNQLEDTARVRGMTVEQVRVGLWPWVDTNGLPDSLS